MAKYVFSKGKAVVAVEVNSTMRWSLGKAVAVAPIAGSGLLLSFFRNRLVRT